MILKNESGKGKTTVVQRFAGFAECHVLYSLLCCPLLFLLSWLPMESKFTMVGVASLLLILYFPLGKLRASLSNWTAPQTVQEKVLAVLLPTIVAWVWVVGVLVSVMGELPELFMVVFAFSVLFAFPSSLFVVTFFVLCPGTSFTVGIGLWGLLAGVLPPLFFAIGSFNQFEKREKRGGLLENG